MSQETKSLNCYIANATPGYTENRSPVTGLKAKAAALLKYSSSHYRIIWQPIVCAVVNNESPRQNTIYTGLQRNTVEPYQQTPKSINTGQTELLFWDTKGGIILVYGNKTFFLQYLLSCPLTAHTPKKIMKEGSNKQTKKITTRKIKSIWLFSTKSSQTESTELSASFQRY